MFDRKSKSVFAFVVPAQGTAYDKVVKGICGHIDDMCYGKVILKSDQERAKKKSRAFFEESC